MEKSPISAKISLDFIPAFEAWAVHASLRGKTAQEAMRKAMRFAVDFLIAKTPKGDRAKIKSDLQQLTTEYQISEGAGSGRRKRIKSAAANNWRGTVAAAIVWRLNYKGARADAAMREKSFYTKVAQFAAGRMYATNLHAAGFKPAQRALHGAAAGVRLPAFRNHPPGDIRQEFNSDTVARIVVENWAQSAAVPEMGRPEPIGARGVIGDRIQEVVPDLARLFERFLTEDILRGAKVAGLKTRWQN